MSITSTQVLRGSFFSGVQNSDPQRHPTFLLQCFLSLAFYFVLFSPWNFSLLILPIYSCMLSPLSISTPSILIIVVLFIF